MAFLSRNRILLLGGVALAMPALVFAVTMAFPQWDPTLMAFSVHFYAVGGTALLAAVACAVVIASAQTLRHTRLLFLGIAFFAIAGVFSVHGLATPGFVVDEYYVSVSVSSWLSAALGSAFVALSVVQLPHKLESWIEDRSTAIFALCAAAVSAYIVLGLMVDNWLEWVPMESRALQLGLGLSAMALSAFAAWRYFQSYQFARLPSQIAMVVTVGFLTEVQMIILWGRVWHLSWWLYHGLYGAAIGVLFIGWAYELKRAGTLRAIADALSMRDALSQLNQGLESPIIELVDAVEAKDRETFGHVRRVSGYALAIGRRLNMSPVELRSLVLAAEMHDVGKISVPDAVLSKPGPLSDEEFDVIKAHTWRGEEIANQVDVLKPLADAIRHHHERLDGSGYPDGLSGDEIPLISRIIAVADTYDAMTSKRPYRDARSHLEAMGEIMRIKGIELDPACVDAFVEELAGPGAKSVMDRVAA